MLHIALVFVWLSEAKASTACSLYCAHPGGVERLETIRVEKANEIRRSDEQIPEFVSTYIDDYIYGEIS